MAASGSSYTAWAARFSSRSNQNSAVVPISLSELVLDIAQVLLGDGEALFEDVEDPGLEPVDVIHSPKATHVTYRIGR